MLLYGKSDILHNQGMDGYFIKSGTTTYIFGKIEIWIEKKISVANWALSIKLKDKQQIPRKYLQHICYS